MFEAGIAYGASSEKRLIVFQCGDKIPWAFRADLFVTINSDDIDKFTRDFHLSNQFFPSRQKALFPHIPQEVLKDRSTQLYGDLRATRPPVLHAPQQIDRWVSITVSLSEDIGKEIRDAASEELAANNQPTILKEISDTAKKEPAANNQPTIVKKTRVEARKTIQKHGVITKHTTTAPQHFGMNDFRGEDNRLVRQAKLGASCRVQVPVGRGIGMISHKG